MSKRKEYESVDLSDLNRSWGAIFMGSWRVKCSQRLSWMSPPMEVLKLNFDGSFIKSLSRGGIEGVI